MKLTKSFTLHFLTLSTSTLAFPSSYFLSENIIGPAFYNHFNFENITDPTHGRVTYVDRATAIRENLTYASLDSFVLKTDAKAVLKPDGPGRNSVRIISKKAYTTHIAVFDVRHMPQGCATWPAIWETKGLNWPTGGEVDILEGVNDQGPNQSTLHTTTGCTMPEIREQTGTSRQLDCDWRTNFNAGCGVGYPTSPASYGPAFNANQGGWYVMERTTDHISVWFWARHDKTVPREIKQGSAVIDTKKWPIPTAHFPNTQCDLKKYFAENNIIINLTLCGDWAGQKDVYAASGCPSTCVDFVEKNPAAFAQAYFEFAAVRVYLPAQHGARSHLDHAARSAQNF